jgi:hypothetical protein
MVQGGDMKKFFFFSDWHRKFDGIYISNSKSNEPIQMFEANICSKKKAKWKLTIEQIKD